MDIRVHKFWQDSKGRKVDAGDYKAGEIPQQLASYLVRNGHADVINPIPDTPAGNALKEQDENTQAVPQEVEAQSEGDSDLRESLIAEYEALTGDTPAWNIKTETLQARLEDLRNGNQADAND